MVYESDDERDIVDMANEVGTASASPFEHTPGTENLLFYAIDDMTGYPGLIYVVKDPASVKLRLHF